MGYQIIRTVKLVSFKEIDVAGGDIGVCVKLDDGRMAWGFAYLPENAELLAAEKARAI